MTISRQVLAGVRYDVERRHHEPRAVADDADFAVELDVVEVLGLRGRLERVGGLLVLEAAVARLPKGRVVVQRHLAVQREYLAVRRLDERVHLDERRVLGGENRPKLHEYVDDLISYICGEACRVRDLAGLREVGTFERINTDLGERLGAFLGELFDVDAAFDAGHREVAAVGAVQQVGDVILLADIARLGHQNAVDGVPLDVHAEDGCGLGGRLVRCLGELDAAGFAAPTGFDLRLDDHLRAEFGRDLPCFVWGLGHLARQDRHVMCGEELLRLVLHQIHVATVLRPWLLTRRNPADDGLGATSRA